MATTLQRPITDATTADLVHAALDQGSLAWEELITRYSPAVRHVVTSFWLPEPEAADTIQNTWLCAFEKLATLRNPESIGGWLKTIARRECLRALRRARREVPSATAMFDIPEDCPGPESIVLTAETHDALAAAIGRLPELQRRLIERAYHGAASDYRSIAHSMNMPIGSVGPTRQRALRWLREQLKDAGYRDTP